MNTTITCNVCGEEFEGERFDDVREDLQEHLEDHAE